MAIDRIRGSARRVQPWLVAQTALFLVLAVSIGILAPWKTEFKGSCVPANAVDTVGTRVYENQKTVIVKRGSIVTVQLGTGAGTEWPWQPPISSNQAVLKPIALCANPPTITTIPVMLSPFKAAGTGRATITALVLPHDAATFATFTLTVIVAP